MMSGVSSRLREILSNLQRKDDPSVRLIALQELSEVLLVSTEDNLSGHFSPDPFVKVLVSLMEPDEFGEENTEMMLLACRCIANLMEALPSATANVVYGRAVPVLCQKLLEIHYIDIAEQALSVCRSFLSYCSSLTLPSCPVFLILIGPFLYTLMLTHSYRPSKKSPSNFLPQSFVKEG
jgi:E3 ubiquitin-protein ligase TRIP12